MILRSNNFLYWRKENAQPWTKWMFLEIYFLSKLRRFDDICHPLQVKNKTFISVFAL